MKKSLLILILILSSSFLIAQSDWDEIDYVKAVNQIGTEASWVSGSFSLQGEYINANALTSQQSTLEKSSYNFNAYYAYASCFITGETRKYRPSIGTFDRTKPKKNFGKDGGAGAWEIAFRYSVIDLDDTDIRVGNIADITAGINWYLNPATRIMLNYLLAELKGAGKTTLVHARIQVDF